jgi:rod shape-determining protein MreD
VNVLGPALFLAVCLGIQAALGRLAPASLQYVDLLIVPVAWYAIHRSQRSAMIVGCIAGLLQDAWFQAALFGISGFCKTFLGWLLGSLATRFDLNNTASWFAAGSLLSVAHNLLELGLRRLLDQVTVGRGPWSWVLEAISWGLLTAVGFVIVERVTGRAGTKRRRAGGL